MKPTRREFLITTATLPLASTTAMQAAASASASAVTKAGKQGAHGDPYAYVDQELRPLVRNYEELFAKQPPLDLAHLTEQRRNTWPTPPLLPDIPVKKLRIPVPGNPEVTIIVLNEKAGTARPGLLCMHGGGFVLGNAESEVSSLQPFAKELDCCIVAVDYRLAPETTWKGSIEDNYAGLKWLHAHAEELGVDRSRIGVMGGSAGGGHAALLALAARDRGEVPLAFQCLTYPMLDDRTASSRAVPWPIGALGWKAEANVFGWSSFLGMKAGARGVPAAAVPARAASLAGLPPTFIGVGSIDLFVEEDIEYALRLTQAGVATELIVVPGATHGFDYMVETRIAKEFSLARLNALRRAFGLAPTV